MYIPVDFQGEIHLHVGVEPEGATEVLRTSSTSVASSAVEELLERFEEFDGATEARVVHDALIAAGWTAYPPTTRSGNQSVASYIRFVYRGKKRETSVFLNTVALVYARKNAGDIVEHVDDAELHNDGSMYLYHSQGRAQAAIVAAELLARWADGEWSGKDA